MRWFSGDIAKAVQLSKSKNAYFVVYVEGSDEKSKLMSTIINESEISARLKMDVFVCIKLEGGSESYNQFAQIYKLVPVPSLFFIGDNGVPVEIVTSDKVSSASTLIPIIDNLLSKKGKTFSPTVFASSSSSESNEKTATSSFLAAEQENMSKTTEVAPSASSTKPVNVEAEKKNDSDEFETVCEGDVCYRKPKVKDSPESDSGVVTPSTSPSTSSEAMDVEVDKQSQDKSQLTMEEKMQRAKELLEQKRKEKAEQEKEEAKKKELERRSQGQGVAELKKWQQEQELKNLKEERLKEKKENEKQRAKILQQIAQDRADKQAQMAMNSGSNKPEPTVQPTIPKPPESNSNITRIQFKMADGSTHTTQLQSDSTLAELRQYVRENVPSVGSYGFTLSTMYPRRLLGEDKNSETLRSLELCPSSVLLVVRSNGSSSGSSGSSAPIANSGGFFGLLSHIFWSFIVHPAQGVWFWITTFFGGSGGASSRPTTSPSEPSTSREFRRFPSEDESDVKKRRVGAKGGSGTTSIRREGNTYRLKDNDSDDENNTWNGNSTQQM